MEGVWKISYRLVLEKQWWWVKHGGRVELTGQRQVASGCRQVLCLYSTLLLGLLNSAPSSALLSFVLLQDLLCSATSTALLCSPPATSSATRSALLCCLCFALLLGRLTGPSRSQPGGHWVQAGASALPLDLLCSATVS